MPNPPFTPNDWYWFIGGDTTQAWSSLVGGMVPAASIPKDAAVSNKPSLQDLSDALRPYRLKQPIVSKGDVKDEASRRILARYPAWKQANMTARAVELLDIRLDNGQWTAGQQAEVDKIKAAWAWVQSVRSASDSLELQATIPTDINDQKHWPVIV